MLAHPREHVALDVKHLLGVAQGYGAYGFNASWDHGLINAPRLRHEFYERLAKESLGCLIIDLKAILHGKGIG